MKILQETAVLAMEKRASVSADLKDTVVRAVREKQPMHELEKAVGAQRLRRGREAMTQLFALWGNGDMGETVAWPDGRCCRRLAKEPTRRYVSSFGAFVLPRVVYGSRAGQARACVPLANRPPLPERVFSYLLPDGAQSLGVAQAFGQASTAVQRMLGWQQSVDRLGPLNQEMAKEATNFMGNRPQPETAGEGVVASADQQGIVRRRSADAPPPKAQRTQGDKASQKRRATVATVCRGDRDRRTPEAVVAAWFRDAPGPSRDRPQPQHQEVWASLPRAAVPGSGSDRALAWTIGDLYLRGRGKATDKPLVCLSDGQEALGEACAQWLPERTVGLLAVLQVTPRLWRAAHVFPKEGSRPAEDFVRDRLLRVLRGEAAGVIGGLRERATPRRVRGVTKTTITTVTGYLQANLERLRYDDYLAAGYPIATGVLEGACRHLVKDRRERAGR